MTKEELVKAIREGGADEVPLSLAIGRMDLQGAIYCGHVIGKRVEG